MRSESSEVIRQAEQQWQCCYCFSFTITFIIVLVSQIGPIRGLWCTFVKYMQYLSEEKKTPHAASEPRRTSPLLQLIYNTQIAFFVGRARKALRALWQVLTQEETICLIIRARTYCASSLFWLSHKHSYLSQSCLWWLRKQDPPTPLLLSWQAWIKDMQRNWVTVVSGNLQQLKVRFFLHLHLHLPSDTWLPA